VSLVVLGSLQQQWHVLVALRECRQSVAALSVPNSKWDDMQHVTSHNTDVLLHGVLNHQSSSTHHKRCSTDVLLMQSKMKRNCWLQMTCATVPHITCLPFPQLRLSRQGNKCREAKACRCEAQQTFCCQKNNLHAVKRKP
jgi:hypothetical protein